MWHFLAKNNWTPPAKDPLSKAERLEQERLRIAIAEAQNSGKIDELNIPCRLHRLLIGVKVV